MKYRRIIRILLILLTCFIFCNGWLEEALQEEDEIFSGDKPISDKEIKDKVRAPMITMPRLFEELHTEFNS